jgi:PA14 domain
VQLHVTEGVSAPRRRLLKAALGGVGGLILLRQDGRALTLDDQKRIDFERLIDLRRESLTEDECTSIPAVATGLRGEYFLGENLDGALLLGRADKAIDFDDSLDWPADQVLETPHSARWTGWLRPIFSGRYTFRSTAANSSLVVSRQPAITGRQANLPGVDLLEGKMYSFVFELRSWRPGRGTRVQLEWSTPLGLRYVVPRDLLYQPIA